MKGFLALIFMPRISFHSLVEAVVKIKFSDDSYCLDCEDEDCSCYPVHGDTVGTMVLQGLSEAQSLVLWSDIREVCLHFRLICWCSLWFFFTFKLVMCNVKVYSSLQCVFRRDLKCCPIFSNLKFLIKFSICELYHFLCFWSLLWHVIEKASNEEIPKIIRN